MSKITNGFELERVLSESKIALKFAQDHKDTIRFCRDNGTWYYFDGNRWKEDPKSLDVIGILAKTTKEYFDNLPKCIEEKHQIKLKRFSNKCLRRNSLKQILACAEIISDVQILKEDFDRNLKLLVTPSGTVDLSTGELRESQAYDYMTKIAATGYVPDLEPEKACPRFIQFMNEVTIGDGELSEHILRILSYCLTGLSTEQKFYLFFGPGANGKSVLLEVLRSVVGSELIIHADSKTLVKNGRNIREDIARFEGARLATCSEIGSADVIDEPLIKGMSGGDRQTSRKLYQNSGEFMNTAKIIFATNCLPALEGTDNGIARRLEVVPFNQSFSDNPDPHLKDQLVKEKEGILALLVQRGKKVIADGVGKPPQVVIDATQNYIDTGNSVRCFFTDCCTTTNDSKKESPLRHVFDTYREYCKQNGIAPCSTRDFSRLLKMMGHEQRKSGSIRYWSGFQLIDNADPSDEQPNAMPLNEDADDNGSPSSSELELPPESKEIKSGDESSSLDTPAKDDTEPDE